VAVRPPDEVLAAVERTLVPARRSMVGPRWATPEQWHLTLQFLGPVRVVSEVVTAVEAAAASRPAFAFRLGGGGAFPTLRRGRVIWIGAAEGGEEMTSLAAAVTGALGPAGYEAEGRRFSPHLTVARLRVPADVATVVAAMGPDPVGPTWTVDEVTVYQSRLSPKGSSYSALARLPLGGGA
jgi:RNA 2',3'-cyclic 3'-phosphodiesterase